jgi:hypothetical protein
MIGRATGESSFRGRLGRTGTSQFDPVCGGPEATVPAPSILMEYGRKLESYESTILIGRRSPGLMTAKRIASGPCTSSNTRISARARRPRQAQMKPRRSERRPVVENSSSIEGGDVSSGSPDLEGLRRWRGSPASLSLLPRSCHPTRPGTTCTAPSRLQEQEQQRQRQQLLLLHPIRVLCAGLVR